MNAARLARHAPLLALTLSFAASRLVYRGVFGMRFDVSPVDYFIQYIHTYFIANDFWRSLLYLHQQAPLQNLIVGGVWKYIGPEIGFAALDIVYVAVGYGFAVTLLTLLRRLGVGPVVATVATIAFSTSPFFALYEGWMFYPLPVACLLATSALALLRYYRLGTFGAASLFFWVVGLVALFRNIYGVVWLAAVVLVLLARPPASPAGTNQRRTLLKAAAAPFLVVWLVGMMPFMLIGSQASSSAFAWANIGYRIYHGIPTAERARLRAEGKISSGFEREPFSPVTGQKELRIPHPPTGVPLLDRATMPDGRGNAFTLEQLLIAEKYLKPDGRYLLQHYPQVYADSVLHSLTDWYFSPPTRDMVFMRTANRRRLLVIERAIGSAAGADANGRYLALVIGLPVAFLFGLWTLLRPRSILRSQRATVAVVAYMMLTISYVTLGTTMISYGDYSRYRFEIDAFYFVLSVLCFARLSSFVARAWRRVRSRSAARTRPPPRAVDIVTKT